MKRLISFVLCLMLVASMFCFGSSAATAFALTANNVTAQRGGNAYVTFSVPANTNVAALKFDVKYDPNVLQLPAESGYTVEITDASAMFAVNTSKYNQNISGNTATESKAIVGFICSGDTGYNTAGKLITLKFTVKTNAAFGDSKLTVTLREVSLYNGTNALATSTAPTSLKVTVNLDTDIQNVIDKINAIPSNVALADEATVTAARSAYNALAEAKRTYVSNYSKLTDAESKIAALKADKAAADAVIAKINAIPATVTLADEATVTAARSAFNALTDAQEALVTNVAKLTAAEATIAALKADKAAADAVIAKINAIPSNVTLADEATVTAARSAFKALTDAQKALVSNLKKLEDAEAAIAALKSDEDAAAAVIAKINAIPATVTLADEATVTAARSAFNALTDAQEALVTNVAKLNAAEATIAALKADKAAADAVIEKIDAIPNPVTLDDEATVADARDAYTDLTDAQKDLVTNLEKLEDAEAAIAALKSDEDAAAAVIAKIDAISDPVTLADESAIAGARDAYDALSDARKDLVTNYDKLTAAEDALAVLKADKAAADAVIAEIDALPEVIALEDEEDIVAARAAYDDLTDAQKDLVTNLEKLEKAEADLAALKETPDVLYGDVDGNGEVTSADALLALQKAVSKIELDENQTVVADVDANGDITSSDALLILQKAVNKIDLFPVEANA